MAKLEAILQVLAVGANVGGRAIKGAYSELRDVLRDHLADGAPQRQALEAVESDAGVWEVRLETRHDGENPGSRTPPA